MGLKVALLPGHDGPPTFISVLFFINNPSLSSQWCYAWSVMCSHCILWYCMSCLIIQHSFFLFHSFFCLIMLEILFLAHAIKNFLHISNCDFKLLFFFWLPWLFHYQLIPPKAECTDNWFILASFLLYVSAKLYSWFWLCPDMIAQKLIC